MKTYIIYTTLQTTDSCIAISSACENWWWLSVFIIRIKDWMLQPATRLLLSMLTAPSCFITQATNAEMFLLCFLNTTLLRLLFFFPYIFDVLRMFAVIICSHKARYTCLVALYFCFTFCMLLKRYYVGLIIPNYLFGICVCAKFVASRGQLKCQP